MVIPCEGCGVPGGNHRPDCSESTLQREAHARAFLEWLTTHWTICYEHSDTTLSGDVYTEFVPTIEDIESIVRLYGDSLRRGV
jgi:hypothetical protein